MVFDAYPDADVSNVRNISILTLMFIMIFSTINIKLLKKAHYLLLLPINPVQIYFSVFLTVPY